MGDPKGLKHHEGDTNLDLKRRSEMVMKPREILMSSPY